MSEYRTLDYKLKMLVLELKAFKSLYDRIESLEKWHVENLVKKNDMSMELSRLEARQTPTVGFLFKKSREKAMDHLREKMRRSELDLQAGEELLKLVYAFVWEKEVATVRALKKNRLKEIIDDFSGERSRKIQAELQLWKGLVQFRLSDELLASQQKKK